MINSLSALNKSKFFFFSFETVIITIRSSQQSSPLTCASYLLCICITCLHGLTALTFFKLIPTCLTLSCIFILPTRLCIHSCLDTCSTLRGRLLLRSNYYYRRIHRYAVFCNTQVIYIPYIYTEVN